MYKIGEFYDCLPNNDSRQSFKIIKLLTLQVCPTKGYSGIIWLSSQVEDETFPQSSPSTAFGSYSYYDYSLSALLVNQKIGPLQ